MFAKLLKYIETRVCYTFQKFQIFKNSNLGSDFIMWQVFLSNIEIKPFFFEFK